MLVRFDSKLVAATVALAWAGQVANAQAVTAWTQRAGGRWWDRRASVVSVMLATRSHIGEVRPFAGGVQNINGDYTNTTTLTASGSADPQTINISNSTFTQTGGGVLNAADGGLITLNSTNVVGGLLTTSGSGTITASGSGSNFLTGVTLAGTLDLASSSGIERVTGGMTLGHGSATGLITIDNNSVLAIEGNQTLGGTGAIVFGATGSGNRLNIESPSGTGTLTVGPNVTIRGQNGTIGGQNFEGGPNALVNNGTISADVSGGMITIVNAPVSNAGLLTAAHGGTLNLQSAVTNTGSGQLTATTGGVLLLNGTSITGGTIATSGGGLFQATGSGNNFVNGVTLNGTIDLASATSIVRVGGGGLTLAGSSTVNINNNSVLAIEGNQTLGGTGAIVFGATGSGNRLNIESPSGTGTLTVGPNVTIRGQNGTIGGQNFEGGPNALVNNGTISADVSGGTITIVNAPVTNTGILQAQNGGTLVLSSNVTGAAGSQIVAGAGSVVLQNGVTISGQINTSGSGSFQASGSGNNFLNAVTLNGGVDLASNTSIERVTGGLTLQNGATINVNNNSVIAFEGTQTLGGSGTILLGSTGSGNRVNIESPGGTSTLTIGPNVIIRGQNGTIGGQNFDGGPNALVNNGTISAEGANGTITIVNAPVTNNGTLQAINGATLVLSSNVAGTTGSHIIAGAGSVVYQNGVTLSGQITTSGSGLLQASGSGNNVLNAVTFGGALDLATNTSIERVSGDLTLQNGATINVNNNSVLAFEGSQTFGGTGTVVLGGTGSGNRINIESPGNVTGTLTVGPNVTIRGTNGTIGGQNFEGGPSALVNNGTISADVSGGTITIVNAPVTNTGILQAQNGGTLVLSSNVTSGNGGQLLAGNGSVVYQNSVTLSGQINTSGTGVVQASGSSSNFLSTAALNGTLDLASNTSIERVSGLTLQNGAAVNVNSNSVLAFEGTQTLGGTGTVLLGNTGSGNRINIESPNGPATLTVGPNITIHGANGTIGGQNFEGGVNALVNNGAINSDGGGTITVVNAPVTNNGVLRAQNGTLTLSSPLNGTGTLRVDAAGVVNLTSNAAVTQGTLAIGAAGATLNNGTQNITLTTDYTNASAGTGNAFDRHAGITGTGQILAGGDVAQAITGAGVTNGTTPSATLTIHNVRVGANTYTYQIANTGTTGPALRGAIQTAVNGGNITDARLSGSGVTAGNYGPVTTGNGGSQTVVFTAASAGALAPLSGQAVNLRSSYDNIGDQQLNIVLGSGAAAYNAAAGRLNTAPLNFGTVQVGQSVSQALSITNAATGPNGFVEDLNASFGASSGTGANRITGIGSLNGLTAGSTNTSALTVTVNTSTAGAVNGAIAVNYFSAGAVNGVSNGLGALAVGSSNYGVTGTIMATGNVVNAANPVINNAPIALGNVRINSTAPVGTVSVTNVASGGQQAALNASISGNAPITGAGSFTLLNPGATNTSSLQVSFNTATAGLKNGTATIGFVSDASNIGGCAPNCQMTLASQNVAVTGAVYRLANPTVNATPVALAARVGDAAPTRGIGVTNASPDAYTERLNAAFTGSGPAGFTTSGSVTGLAAQGSSSALTVALNTSTAGTFGGGVSIASVSSGAGTTGAADLAVGSTSVAVSGKVYAAAVGHVAPTAVNFGIVHVGDAVAARDLEVTNAAAPAALNDVLRGSISGGNATFAVSGTLGSGLAAGATDHTSLTVGLNTGTAGIYNASAAVALTSHDADLADLGLGTTSVQLTGQVNNYAADDFSKTGGAGVFSRLSATDYVLDFGTLAVGSGPATAGLAVDNTATGIADFLNGSFGVVGSGFAFSGFSPFTNIAAGSQFAGLGVTFTGSTAGTFSEVFTLNGYGTNASGYRGDLGAVRLTVRGTVGNMATVPEPTTYVLVGAGLLTLGLARRRQRVRLA